MARLSLIATCHNCDRRQPVSPGVVVCRESGDSVAVHAKAASCPLSRFAAGVMPLVPAAPMTLGERGRQLWGELHCRALVFDGTNVTEETRWLDDFFRRLPCGDCKKHWKLMIAATPPRWNNSADYFRWTVDLHNEVNRRLGKPELSVEGAQTVWEQGGSDGPPPDSTATLVRPG